MRTWTINGKYPVYNSNGKVDSYEVTISSNGRYAAITETIKDPELLSRTDDDIIRLVLQEFSKSEFAEYHVSEAVQKVENFDTRLLDAVKEIEQIKATYKQSIDDMTSELRGVIADSKRSVDAAISSINSKVELHSSSLSKLQDKQDMIIKDLKKDSESIQERIRVLENAKPAGNPDKK